MAGGRGSRLCLLSLIQDPDTLVSAQWLVGTSELLPKLMVAAGETPGDSMTVMRRATNTSGTPAARACGKINSTETWYKVTMGSHLASAPSRGTEKALAKTSVPSYHQSPQRTPSHCAHRENSLSGMALSSACVRVSCLVAPDSLRPHGL